MMATCRSLFCHCFQQTMAGQLGTMGIAQYQHGQWTSWPATAPGDLTSLQMLAATDGWAAGVAPHALFQDSPHTLFLLHYDGNTWAPVRLPAMAQYANSLSQLTGFAFVSPSEGWAIGGGQSLPLGLAGCQAGSSSCQDTSEVSILLHYTGGHWEVVARSEEHTSELQSRF